MPPSADARLTFRQAIESPCLQCRSSPCCTHLLLGTIPLTTMAQVDHALFLLNFDGIYLTPSAGADTARLYLYQPCGHLDTDSGLCTIHATPELPAVCSSYKAQSCDYRWVFGEEGGDRTRVADHRRMAWLAEQMVFDDQRRVVATPTAGQIAEAWGRIPLEHRPAPSPGTETGGWQPVALRRPPAGARYGFEDSRVSEPCTGCAAWCCRTLEFDRGLPANVAELEFLRYSLGFPSIELNVSDRSWSLVVHTTCRHLAGGRCSLHGQPERPLECEAYDELGCQYRIRYGAPDPSRVRLSGPQFRTLADLVVFDQLGRILAVPSVEVLQQRMGEVAVPADPGPIHAPDHDEEGDPLPWR